jgi:hypothetical protein
VIYLYALIDRDHDLSSLTGITREQLRGLQVGDVVAVVGGMDVSPSPTRETLEAQDQVVRALRQRADALLPARFGTVYPDDASLERAIQARAADLRQRFDVVRDREQMTLRVVGPPSLPGSSGRSGEVSPKLASNSPRAEADATGASTPGVRYLEERARRAMPPAVAALVAAVRPVQRGARIEAGRSETVLATMYHLIAPEDVEVYRQLVKHTADSLPGIRVVVSGPSPAYAFADLDVATA